MKPVNLNRVHPLMVPYLLGKQRKLTKANRKTISASELNMRLQEAVLKRRLIDSGEYNKEKEISEYVAASNGTAIHAAIEESLKNKDILNSLWDYDVMDDFTKSYLNNHNIPTELKGSRPLDDKYTLVGRFDAVWHGMIIDFKTTTMFSYLKKTYLDYQMQMSAYKYMFPKLITRDVGQIIFLITDFKKPKESDKPSICASETLNVPLLSEEEFRHKALLYAYYVNKKFEEDEEIMSCTDEQRMATPGSYEVYTKKTNKTPSAKFPTLHKAQEHISIKMHEASLSKDKRKNNYSLAAIKYKAGKNIFCEKMCSVSEHCKQFKKIKEKEEQNGQWCT